MSQDPTIVMDRAAFNYQLSLVPPTAPRMVRIPDTILPAILRAFTDFSQRETPGHITEGTTKTKGGHQQP